MSVRRIAVALTAVAVAAAGVLALTAGPAAALPGFGTAPVTGGAAPVTVTAVTTGSHAGFDRVVFTSTAAVSSWEVRYVTQVTADPSGTPIPLAGAADILVVVHGTDWMAHPSAQPNLSPGLPALRQVRGAGEFEGVLSYGIGQQRKAGFRVFTLTGPDRLVVDVAV
ncbi:MAG TPA: hypothetical protein VLM05_01660 [Mycobacteriales bacterium]|nr:hypothetical protein [Mycobacteriales bacterium]